MKARPTSDATREALLAAMGHDASSEAAAGEALRLLDARQAAKLLDPARILVGDSAAPRQLTARTGLASGTKLAWQLEVRGEDGLRHAGEGGGRAGRRGALRLPLPALEGPGDFRIELKIDAAGAERRAEQRLALCPVRCFEVSEALGDRQGLGMQVNLYALRSPGDWGVGDLGDLARLCRRAGRWGLDFVGLNPLHATRGSGLDVSPYSPVSRLRRNEAYLKVEAIPELESSPPALQRLSDPSFQAQLAALRARDRVDWDAVGRAKREILLLLHGQFARQHRDGATRRSRAYARFLTREGPALLDYATFVALAEQQSQDGHGADWRRWPAHLQRCDAPGVTRFRERNAERIDFHCWIQFELDRQLAAAARAGERAGLGIGLYADLAVGSDPGGFDTWAWPDVHARGVRVGAPPDDFSPTGQDWGFPPLAPAALADRAFDDWTRLLRANMEHAGMLRLDHAMGLERLWWIPEGAPSSEGAYVRYPTRSLLGLLALESRKSRTVVVGEDLGTVPRGFPSRLARRGILSLRVLAFERQGRGFRRPEAVSPRALVVSSSHDLAPLAGHLAGRDLELRDALGALPDPEAARQARTAEARALRRRLGLPDGALRPGSLATAALDWLRATPAPLVAMPLEDWVEAREPVNLPGVPQELHASWTRRLEPTVDQLGSQPALRRLRRER